MKITVTKEDIKRGKLANEKYCPVARAVRRATRKRSVEAFGHAIYIAGERHMAPASVARFIEDLDEGRSVDPFSFTI